MTVRDAGAPAIRAFLFGNFVIGCGVMLVPGMLNTLATGLQISVPKAGQLVGIAAFVLCLGAPITAAITSRIDRRLLLTGSLLLYAAGHLACLLAPDFATLAVLRAVSVFGAAVFTPQAAATIALIVPVERRSAAITAIFLGWSLAAVAGMPLANLIGAHFGWRAGFAVIAGASMVAAAWTWLRTPPGLTVPALSMAAWREVGGSAPLVLTLLVTLASATGQFTLFSYLVPALLHALGASPAYVAGLLALLGVAGVLGNALTVRVVQRLGVHATVSLALGSIAIGMVLWALIPWFAALAWPLVLIALPLWGIGLFSSNSAQQARLGAIAPALASASIALNSSCIYGGQAIGAVFGGGLIAVSGFDYLPIAGLVFMLVAITLSRRAAGSRSLHTAEAS